MKTPRKVLLETKILFCSTLAVISLVILSVWFSGMSSHRSLFQNSIVSTSVITGSFFLFISLGLYYGLKLKDNVGNILSKEKLAKYPSMPEPLGDSGVDIPDAGDGIGGIILSVILWFLFSILITFALYFLGFFFWSAVLLLCAMLYWVFFRALRLVFKNSRRCKGDLLKSFGLGFFYSFLYAVWIYGIIFLINYTN